MFFWKRCCKLFPFLAAQSEEGNFLCCKTSADLGRMPAEGFQGEEIEGLIAGIELNPYSTQLRLGEFPVSSSLSGLLAHSLQ